MSSPVATWTNRWDWMQAPLVLVAGVIERARRRHRRRQQRLVVLLLAATTAGAIAYVSTGAHGASPPSGPPAGDRSVAVAPSSVLGRSGPYMGLACRRGVANSIVCGRSGTGRVGFAVWLRRPAATVTATIAGRPLRLHGAYANQPTTWAVSPRKAFTGYLRLPRAVIVHRLHAPVDHCSRCATIPGVCAHWCDARPASKSTPIALRIRYPSGEIVTTRVHLPLEPGWG